MATLSDDQKKNFIDQEIGKIINPYRRIIKEYALQRRVGAVEEFTVELFQQLENFINLHFQKSSLFPLSWKIPFPNSRYQKSNFFQYQKIQKQSKHCLSI